MYISISSLLILLKNIPLDLWPSFGHAISPILTPAPGLLSNSIGGPTPLHYCKYHFDNSNQPFYSIRFIGSIKGKYVNTVYSSNESC